MKELFKEFLRENNIEKKFERELELSINSFFGDEVVLVDEFLEAYLEQVKPENYMYSCFPFNEVEDKSVDWIDISFKWVEKLTSELIKRSNNN